MRLVSSLLSIALNKIAQDKTLSETTISRNLGIPRGRLGYTPVEELLDIQHGFFALHKEVQDAYLAARFFLNDTKTKGWVNHLDAELATKSRSKNLQTVMYAIYEHGHQLSDMDKRSAESKIAINFREISVALLCNAYLKHGTIDAEKKAVIQLQKETLFEIGLSLQFLRDLNEEDTLVWPTTSDGLVLRDYALILDQNLLSRKWDRTLQTWDSTESIEKAPLSIPLELEEKLPPV